ncbi:MAG TPA: ABC transporter permease [Gemmataceae bacterium]|nr:ABC transporter permease [Gemmataceae bacterium]
MRKVWVVARREYRAAVRTKAFVVSIVLMPALMLASIGIQVLFKKLEDTGEKKFVVVDRTGGELAAALSAAAEKYNQHLAIDPETKKQVASRIQIEVVPPSDGSPDAVAAQRYELSQRVSRDEIEGIVEIGPKVFEVRGDPFRPKDKVDDAAAVRFQAKKPAQRQFTAWAEQALNAEIRLRRFRDRGIDPAAVAAAQESVPLKYHALTRLTPAGTYEDARQGAQLANFFLPAVLIALMFMVVMVGATPAMHGVVEEKGQRIAEVLLGSLSPLELMAGKLLGLVGVSLTMAVVYLAGGYVVAQRYGVADMLSPALMVWFGVFLVLALLIYGSLFIAVGAAAGDVKDTQTLLLPVMLVACLPFFALGPIMQDPNGPIAVACSWFPFATPFLLVARQSVPPGVPAAQMAGGIAVVLATTLGCVWAAGRIFRVGLLAQGKGAKFGDLFRWVLKG